MQQHEAGRHQHRVGGGAPRAKPRDGPSAGQQIERIRHRRAEHQRAAEQQRRAVRGQAQVAREGERDAGVTQRERHALPPGDPAPAEPGADHHHQRRVGEQDQPLESGADVGEAPEIENAGEVIAGQAEPADAQPVARRQPRAAGLCLPGQRQEERQRAEHSQRQQRYRIHGMPGIGQLHEDGLQREAKRRQQGVDGAGKRRIVEARRGHADQRLTAGTQCSRWARYADLKERPAEADTQRMTDGKRGAPRHSAGLRRDGSAYVDAKLAHNLA